MSLYQWDELLIRWQSETLTSEQAIGQLLLWAQEAATQLAQLVKDVGRQQRHLEITDSRLERLERPPSM